MNTISIKDIFSQSWGIVKGNIFIFALCALAIFGIQGVFEFAVEYFETESASALSWIFNLIATVVSLIITVSTMSALIKIARGSALSRDLLAITGVQVLRYVGVTIILALLMLAFAVPVIGAALFFGVTAFVGVFDAGIITFLVLLALALIALVYINIRLMFAPYLVIDGKAEVFTAFRRSWDMTEGNVWKIIVFGIVGMLITLLGFLALIVGLLVAAPLVALAASIFYVTLEKEGELLSHE